MGMKILSTLANGKYMKSRILQLEQVGGVISNDAKVIKYTTK